jgi:hypothetical protein
MMRPTSHRSRRGHRSRGVRGRAAAWSGLVLGLVGLAVASCGEESNRKSPPPAIPGVPSKTEAEPWIPPAANGGVKPAAVPGASLPPARFESAAQCGSCHKEIYAEWQASWHGQAMVDPLFLRLSDGLKQEECIRCHAPVPLREMENWETPIARNDRREDADSCLTCHQSGDGVAGPFETKGPCRPVKDDAQRDPVKICFACHNQHKTGEEWLAGPYAPDAPAPRKAESMTCLDCHMPWVDRPLVEGGEVRHGRRHTWPGGHSMEQLKKAGKVDVECKVTDAGTEVRTWLTNVGAGHNIPTDARHRSFDVYVKVWDAAGKLILDPLDPDPAAQERCHTLKARLNYRNSNKPDTQVPPLARLSKMGEWAGSITVPGVKSGRGEAWLVYRLTPEDALTQASLDPSDAHVAYRARRIAVVEFTFGG